MKTDIHVWIYLAEFFLEWEMLETKVVQKLVTHILCSATPPSPPRKSCHLGDNVEKICIEWSRPCSLQAGQLRLHTHTLRIRNTLLFHCNNGLWTHLSVTLYVQCLSVLFVTDMPLHFSLRNSCWRLYVDSVPWTCDRLCYDCISQ